MSEALHARFLEAIRVASKDLRHLAEHPVNDISSGRSFLPADWCPIEMRAVISSLSCSQKWHCHRLEEAGSDIARSAKRIRPCEARISILSHSTKKWTSDSQGYGINELKVPRTFV